MQHLEALNLLIDAASKIAGSDGKLALALGVPKQHISHWRHGHKNCQPEDQGLMASIAGFDPIQTLARATVEYWEGKPKGDRLMRALGKALLVTGGAIGSAGASAAAIFSTIPTTHSAWTWISTLAIQFAEGKIGRRNKTYVNPVFG